MTSRI